jgi:D-beta-D-heptose 7-phosphate kinase/D-beta-D-heptose 1-phosphate adenosyltransferase
MSFYFQETFSKSKILVIGDIMLDHYVIGSVSRISPEAPVPVLLKESEKHYLGGAGNVFSNIQSLSGSGDIISIIGDDVNGDHVERMVSEKSTLSILLRSKNRRTTTKSRYIGNSHQLLRVDDEDCSDIDSETELYFLERLENIIDFYDCIILEDYNKGLLTPNIITRTVELCKDKNKPLIVDPKIKNVEYYRGCTVIKPNFSEFCILADSKIDISDFDQIIEEARKILYKMDIREMLVTLSDLGILRVTKYEHNYSKGYPINVSDVSGAGDTVTAMFALCLSSGIDIKETLNLCNIAGSIACSSVGAISVKIDDIINSKHLKKY